jgi:hypothetical protein
MTQTAIANWMPTKPSDDYNEDELRETPIYEEAVKSIKASTLVGMLSEKEAHIIAVTATRQTIKERWNKAHPEKIEEDIEEDEDEDDGELRSYEISVEVPLTIKFKVEAHNEDDAYEIAVEELREMRLKTFLQAMTAEMVGVTDRNGVASTDVSLDYPETLNDGDISVDDDR